jgi:FkbM family methyltransferase
MREDTDSWADQEARLRAALHTGFGVPSASRRPLRLGQWCRMHPFNPRAAPDDRGGKGKMSGIVRYVRNLLKGTPAFVPARNVYRIFMHLHFMRDAKAMRRFYAQFIHRGDVVFDIGANVGEYTEAFADLGAHVVAVDPNPVCAAPLRHLANVRDIEVELCAVGDRPGTVALNTCQFSFYATANDEFLAKTKGDPDYAEVEWDQRIDVPVVTMDRLAERHGTPAFVKIDVEGFEDKVIAGMSFRPAALSFEFTIRARDIAMRALSILDGYEFNAVAARNFDFVHSRWLHRDELISWLNEYDETPYGDIVARRVSQWF